MACIVKTTNAKNTPGVAISIFLGLFLGLSLHVKGGSDVDSLQRTLGNMGQIAGFASSASAGNDSREKNLLVASKNRLSHMHLGTDYESHRAEALKDVSRALDDFNKNDHDPEIGDLIAEAMEECSAALEMAKNEPDPPSSPATPPPAAQHADNSSGTTAPSSTPHSATSVKPSNSPDTPSNPGTDNSFGTTKSQPDDTPAPDNSTPGTAYGTNPAPSDPASP